MGPESEAHPHVRVVAGLAWASALLESVRSGLLEHLIAEGPVEAPGAAIGLDADVVDRVLRVLEAHGWAERSTAGWCAPPWLAAENGPFGVGRMLGVFAHLPTALQDGSVVHHGEVRHDSRVVTALAELTRPASTALAEALGPVDGVVLDVGCGAASWSLAMIERSPEARLVALDREEVLRAAVHAVEAMGLSDRVALLPGSFWDLEWPRARRVVIANVVHLLDDAEAAALVRKGAEALEPGGSLVLVDALPPSGVWSPEMAGYALNLRLREPHGTVHAPERIRAWMEAAGLCRVRTLELPGTMRGLGAVASVRPLSA